MKVPHEPFHDVVDLAEAWQAMTGLAVRVRALGGARAGSTSATCPKPWRGAGPRGWPMPPTSPPIHGPRLGLDFTTCYDYLTRVLSYDLGEPEIAGLSGFAPMAARLGLAPEGVTLSSTVAAILHRAVEGDRLGFDDGVELLRSAALLDLGRAADAVCRRLHPEPFRTYNIDRNINYTNVCAAVCDFCAFYRKVGDTEAYVLDRDVLLEKIRETVDLGGDQILMQGRPASRT